MTRTLPEALKNGPPLVLDAVRGCAVASVTWLVYDTLLQMRREVDLVWRARWSLSKALYLFVRYHSIVVLSWYLMQAVGDTPFRLNYHPIGQDPPSLDPTKTTCFRYHAFSLAGRWYVGMSEVFTMLLGEALILLRINSLYGWSKGWVLLTLFLFCSEATVGFVTTILTLRGGSKSLTGSLKVLDCSVGSTNSTDVNLAMWITSFVVACIFLYLLLRKASEFSTVTTPEHKFPLVHFLQGSDMAPILHLVCRDGAIYFLSITSVILVNLVLAILRSDYSPMGTPLLIGVYSIATTRIFLNLKEGPRQDNTFQLSSSLMRETPGPGSSARFAANTDLESS